MNNWQHAKEFCDQSWNITNFAHKYYQICALFADIKKLGIGLESLHFPQDIANVDFEQKHRDWKLNGYGKIKENS